MTTRSYVPRADPRFAAWAEQFAATLAAAPVSLGRTPAEAAAVTAKVAAWQVRYDAHVAAQAAAAAAVGAKDAARRELETLLRATPRAATMSSAFSGRSLR